jgi:hypothetical protein
MPEVVYAADKEGVLAFSVCGPPEPSPEPLNCIMCALHAHPHMCDKGEDVGLERVYHGNLHF